MTAVSSAMVLASVAFNAEAQNQANLSPGVADIGRLVASKVPDDTILNFAKGSGINYHLSSEDIIFLTGQGASQPVLNFLLQSGTAPTAAPTAGPPPDAAPAVPNAPTVPDAPQAGPPAAPAPPPPDGTATPNPQINLDYFRGQLSPYGAWVDLPPYGQVWRPAAAIADPTWRPYSVGGHWTYTEQGWYWQADDPWGTIVFHYGRWNMDPTLGWIWVPDYVWGPSWVAWRHSEGFYGWAPLPPAARFEAGVGLSFGGVAVGASFDFGLHADAFTFVGYDHLWEHDYHAWYVPRERVTVVFGASVIENNYRVEGGRFVVVGFGREHVFAHTHHEVEVVRVHDVVHREVVVRETVNINKTVNVNTTVNRNVNVNQNTTINKNVNVNQNTTVNKNVNVNQNVNANVNKNVNANVNSGAAAHPASTPAAGNPSNVNRGGFGQSGAPAAHPATGGGVSPGSYPTTHSAPSPGPGAHPGAAPGAHPPTGPAAKKPPVKPSGP
jgi:hypothetical protein